MPSTFRDSLEPRARWRRRSISTLVTWKWSIWNLSNGLVSTWHRENWKLPIRVLQVGFCFFLFLFSFFFSLSLSLSSLFPLSVVSSWWRVYRFKVILSAKWQQGSPYLCKGPLEGNYVFAQVHFHWGENEMRGSEHFVDGARFKNFIASLNPVHPL